MKAVRINLYSDTQSQPTLAMREAMASAEVGDEQHRLDPSVNKLCHEVTELLGKDCLLYTSPSPRDQRGSRMPSSA